MIKVDKNKCISCAMCVASCPDVFAIDNDGKSEVTDQKNISGAREAAANCPVGAITVD